MVQSVGKQPGSMCQAGTGIQGAHCLGAAHASSPGVLWNMWSLSPIHIDFPFFFFLLPELQDVIFSRKASINIYKGQRLE